ncbi:helix-turn-helix domain-containing protein [Halorarius halobius]|uniref:helix-turn-helix domain-containing protein n=1 Tax=Halorarius halobius TaxID=2962671 RepID=UPI0020CDA103|nr:helix-turn-helix domain-containing protein [Halorarius halobius]
MRQAILSAAPPEGFHPIDRAVAEDPDVRRRSIEAISLLEDGTCVVLYWVDGDLDRAAEITRDHPGVHEFELHRVSDDSGLSFVHLDATEVMEALLVITRREAIVVRPPIGCLPDGGVRVTIVGTDGAISDAVEAAPDSLDVRLERFGPYEPSTEEDFFASLTSRQRDTFTAAMELGYYEVPRRTTHEELAEELGVSRSTVGEHLRKIEARALSTLAPARFSTE